MLALGRRGLILVAFVVAACDDRAPSPAATVAPNGAPLPSAPRAASALASAPAPTATGSAGEPGGSLELLKMTLTSAVKNKDPVDRLDAAAPGDRVYAHLKFRNRSEAEREVTVVFKVNGKTRTTLKLDIEPSWSFRSWGYNTLHADDAGGELSVTVVDDAGAELARAALPILKKAN